MLASLKKKILNPRPFAKTSHPCWGGVGEVGGSGVDVLCILRLLFWLNFVFMYLPFDNIICDECFLSVTIKENDIIKVIRLKHLQL